MNNCDKKIAVYPGSFDPITNGHIDILERAARIFDEVIIAVFINTGKKSTFSLTERVEMLREATKDMKNVRVDAFEGLLSNYVKQHRAKIIVRGLRGVKDFDLESQMALMNRDLNPNVDTVFLMASSNNICVSSSIIKEVVIFGGDVSHFVPLHVENRLKEKFNK